MILVLFIVDKFRNAFPLKSAKEDEECRYIYISGVCLGGKLSPFSDILQNSTLERRKKFRKKNVN